ncbi:MAG: hypothetical protein SynsKO_04700 [Synoicihabitans sp.]
MENLNIACIISAKESDGMVAVFKEVVGPKSGPPLHLHKNQTEIFHVISGRIRFQLEGQITDVETGGTAIIPPGKAHAFVNLSDEDSIIHFELLPSGNAETFFEKLTTGDFDDPQRLFADHDLELLGPPLELP